MKNKVTVSRAHRLKTVPFKEIPDGTLCLNSSGITINDKPEVGISLKAGGGLIRVSESYHLDYKIPSDGYVTFDSFDDMCKWVANGKRLEDLCSHVQDLVDIEHMELGSYATVIGLDRDEDYEGETVFAHPHPRGYTLVETSCECSFPLRTKVWPLRAGDTITIEITE